MKEGVGCKPIPNSDTGRGCGIARLQVLTSGRGAAGGESAGVPPAARLASPAARADCAAAAACLASSTSWVALSSFRRSISTSSRASEASAWPSYTYIAPGVWITLGSA